MAKDFKEFAALLDRGEYAERREELAARFTKQEPSVDRAAMEYAREVALLTVELYHEWLSEDD